MENNKDLIPNNTLQEEDDHSYKGALFSSIVFVGGTILANIVLLIVVFMTRI